ncbi:hypothetical protein NW768_004645, partial [Fusarium equiseti]
DNEEDDEYDPENYKVPKNPFKISTAVLPGKSVTIPISHLDFESPFLYRKLEVPDVITWIHYGDCELCGGENREFCAGCNGKRILNNFTYVGRSSGDCGIRMLCPLCIGVEYAVKSISYDPDYESDEEEQRAYYKWVWNRKRELSYA